MRVRIHQFHNMSIRAKLTMLMVLTSMIVLMLASGLFVVKDVVNYRTVMIEDLTVLADVIGRNSSAALVFNDEDAASEILSALSAQPHVIAAVIHTIDGNVLASYGNSGVAVSASGTGFGAGLASTEQDQGNHHFWGNSLELFSPVILDGETLGQITIWSDLKQIDEQFLWDMIAVGAVFLVC